MRVVAIIPARAGSKRLPGKCLRKLGGRPLIAHTVGPAIESGIFAAVHVNTDSPEIALAAQQVGATCPALRPAALARDESPTRDAIVFMLNHLAQRGTRYDALMVLQPTSPLRTAEDIRAAWDMYEHHQPCCVVSVSPTPPQSWFGDVDPAGRFKRWEGEHPLHRLNGAIYVYPARAYLAGTLPETTFAYVMPPERGVDIDTLADFELAAALLREQRRPTVVEVEP